MKKLATIAAFILFLSGTLTSMNDISAEKSKPAEKASTETAMLNGKVVDSNTAESLTGVTLEIVGTDILLYTDFDGNFEVNDIEPGTYTIIVRYVSYQGHLLENVFLKKGQNTLSQVMLNPAR